MAGQVFSSHSRPAPGILSGLMPFRPRLPSLVLPAAAVLALLGSCRRSEPVRTYRSASAAPVTVWAWKEPEDLRSIDPRRIGVAYLAETVVLSDHLTAEPRHQPLRLASGTRVLAVVRIEAVRGFRDTPELRSVLAHHLGDLAAQTRATGLQLDFDAVVSQYPFYTAVLESLRALMAPGLSLSITALVSWCRSPSWLSGLAIDEAVPMFFRMGGPAVNDPRAPNPLHGSVPPSGRWSTETLAPPCRKSFGLSTDEPWPQLPAGAGLYLFSPTPWSPEQIHTLDTLDIETLAAQPGTLSR